MPQIFQVLKCYKCSLFQVHLRKKSNKWECKVCGEKQSIKRHYGIGTGSECRVHVQKLNKIKGDKDESNLCVDMNSPDEENIYDRQEDQNRYINIKQERKSKWDVYIQNNENIGNTTNNTECCDDEEIASQIPKGQKLVKLELEENSSVNLFAKDRNKKSTNKFKSFQKRDDVKKATASNKIIRTSKWDSYITENKPMYDVNNSLVPKTKEPKYSDDGTGLEHTITFNKRNYSHINKQNNQCYERNSKWAMYVKENEVVDIDNKYHNKDILANSNDSCMESCDYITPGIKQLQNPPKVLCNYEECGKNLLSIQNNEAIVNIEDKTLSIKENQTQSFFSLCDDTELDDILKL